MRQYRWFCLVGILLASILLCGAADPKENYEDSYTYNMECAYIILDAFMAGDPDPIFELVDVQDKTQFLSNFDRVSKAYTGNVCYELEVSQNRSYTEHGQLIHRSNYRVTFSDERVCAVVIASLDNKSAGLSFEINPLANEEAENRAPGWLKGLTLLLTFASWGLMVWMTVDCIRRPMKKWQKVLWIISFYAYAGIALQWYAHGFYVLFKVGLLLPACGISCIGGLWKLQLLLPVGAMVYFFLRKRISAKYLAARKAYYESKAPLDFSLDDQ